MMHRRRPIGGSEPHAPHEESRKWAEVRSWRRARIARFKERQQQVREWVSFEEIAAAAAREDGGVEDNEEKRALSYRKLGQAIAAGEFDRDGRSRVLHLNPESNLAKMTRDRFREISAAFSEPDIVMSGYLQWCWIPRGIAIEWARKENLRAVLARIEAPAEAQPHDPPPAMLPGSKRSAPTKRTRPERERAESALRALFPNGVPDQVTLPNALLCVGVELWCREKNQPGLRKDTILRAAGRRN